ncbi:MAG: TonB-dependent receptor [Acidobacteriota bacterium]
MCNMNKRLPCITSAVLSVLVLLMAVVTVNAQFKAGVQGFVTDVDGAVIERATVSVINQETGKEQTITTNSQGFYRVTGLPPGSYKVSVEFEGFKKKVNDNVIINAEALQRIDFILEAGELSEVVTVNSNAEEAKVQTENANIDRALTNREILRLPQSGRDPYQLLRLTPGVFGNGARTGDGSASNLVNTTGPGGSNTSIFQVENQVPISANGQRVSANNYQIDGVSVNSLSNGGAAVVTPNQESVKEVSIVSSSYSAEDGRNTGAQIKVVSQNGTNEFHGSAVIKYNDPDLNAFNKFGGITGNPKVNAPPVRVEQLLRQFAGSVGGPIIKEKLFFFFSFEGLRSNNTNFANTFIETSQYRQLVIAQRPGSVTARIFQSPGIVPRIAQLLGADCSIFGNGTPCRMVAGGLDIGSLVGRLGQYVPFNMPAGGGLDGIPDIQFVQLALPNITRGDQYNARFDYNRGSTDRFAVSMYFTRRNDFLSDAGGRSRPMADLTFKPLNSAATVTWIRTISPTVVNEARANFTRFSFNQADSNQDVNFGIPRVEVESLPFDRIRFGVNRSETTPAKFAQNTFEVRDTLSLVRGNHGLKFGFEFRREQDNNNLIGGARPIYSFAGLFNLANDTPIFEAINVDPATGLPADAQRYFRTSTYSYFIQDDWKFRPNITFNIGLRYEYFTPLREAKGRISNLAFGTGARALLDAKLVSLDELFQPDRNNFAPRFGFAWSPKVFNNKAVLRGGFGIAYNRTPGVLFSNTRGNPPFFARYSICCGTAGSPQDNFGSPFAEGRIIYTIGANNSPLSFPVNAGLAQGIDPITGGIRNNTVEIYATESRLPNAYLYSYSLDVEYQLPWNLVASVGYQGSSGHKFIRLINGPLFFETNARFDPVFILRPDVNTNYHAMLLRLTRGFANGLRFDANYRWAKSIDTLSFEGPGAVTNQTNPGDLASERGPSDFDTTHYFVLSALWDLPFFRGRNNWVEKLLGGWQINGILTAHTGFSYTPKIFRDLRQPSGRTFGPIRPPLYFGGARNDSSDEAFLTGNNFPGGGAKFFLIDSGSPGIGRNSFRGPRYGALDLSIVKEIKFSNIPKLGERTKLELRANLFNALNSLNLAPIGFFDAGAIVDNPNFGRSMAGLAGRVIEFQARFSF